MLHKSRPKWLLWSSVVILIIFLACFSYGVYLYNNLYDSKTAGFNDTSQHILNQTAITEIEKIEQYNGSASFHVIFGKNAEDEEKLIFYPLEGNEKSLTTIDRDEIIPEEDIVNQWQSSCDGCEIVKVTPALENNEALWEITYKDKNQYAIEYVSIYDGSPVEQYRFTRMFK